MTKSVPIVENRAGAAQNVAAEYIAKQLADGYTLFLSSAALGVKISLYPKLNCHPVRDFAPVAESPDYFRKMLAQEIERWAKVIQVSKAKPE